MKTNLISWVGMVLDTGTQLSVMFDFYCGSFYIFGLDQLFLSQAQVSLTSVNRIFSVGSLDI